MTREEFLKAMTFMGAAYGKRIPQEQVEVWYTFFHDDDAALFRQAVSRAISKSRFMPSVAELKSELALIKYPVLQLDVNTEWETVQNAVRHYGYYNADKAIESLNPFTQRIVRLLGGISAICMSDGNDWTRKEFVRLFGDLYDAQSTALSLSESQLTAAEIHKLSGETLKQIEVV